MRSAPWFKFYPGDWLGGTRALTALETGVYISLIALMYDGAAPLTLPTSRLARMCGATQRQFDAALARLIELGKIVKQPDGGLWNDRVCKELHAREEKICKAKASASGRYNQNTLEKQGGGAANAEHSQSERNAMSDFRDQISERVESATHSLGNAPPEGHPPDPGEKVALLNRPPDYTAAAVVAWNELAVACDLPQVSRLTEERRSRLKARLAECGGIEGWAVALEKIRGSKFLRGEKRDWKCDFDFVLQKGSFTKLMEGRYDDKHGGVDARGGTGRAGKISDAFARLEGEIAVGKRGAGLG